MKTHITMNKNKAIALTALVVLIAPTLASAHETRMYEINGVSYEIVMGSLGEPVLVDDKTGVELEIVREGEMLAGAQESLQVELIAGDTSKVVSLSPVYGSEGKYKSNFIATVPTTITYRLFGTLEDTPIDLSFTCNPAGHPQSEEDTKRTNVADGVIQTLKRGAFGCPQDKTSFGFPEAVESNFVLQRSLTEAAAQPEEKDVAPYGIAIAALLVSLIATALVYKNTIRK